MSSFNEEALASLTAKLEKKLPGKVPADKKAKAKPQRQQDESSGKREKQGKANKSQPSPPSKPSTKRKRTPEQGRNEPAAPQSSKKTQKAAKPKTNGKQNPRDLLPDSKVDTKDLLSEIKALGGDEKDLELIGDVDSEDELEAVKSTPKADKDLRAELAKFASGLGFDKIQPDDAEEVEKKAEEDENANETEIEEVADAQPDGHGVVGKEDATAQLSKAKRKTIFEPRPDWHAVELEKLPDPLSDDIAPYMAAIKSLKAYAMNLLEEDTKVYETTMAASSSRKFMSTIIASGTVSDKTSALTLAIQESPVHSIKPTESLIGLAAKRSRGQALSASAALVDLLGPGTILPPNRRLRMFASQPELIGSLQKHGIKSWSPERPLPRPMSPVHLIYWAFEDWLKTAHFKVIQALESWCDDEIEYSRSKAIDMVYALLKDKPEQESNLLRLLVNKLGDRERKIASRASHLLLELLNIHPGMKAVVIQAVEEVIFRPGQSIRAKYYAVNTLNQTILSGKEPQIADSLLNIYFGMFVALLKNGDLGQIDGYATAPKPDMKGKRKRRRDGRQPKKDNGKDKKDQADREAAEKLVSAILTGINRAVPFSQTDSSTLEAHLDTLFRITHSSNFNTSIQALMLIQQMSSARHLATERFYRTLYESLLDPRLATSSKQALYLNLVYRSLKSDVDVRRVKAFVKRMLQILTLHQAPFVCGILYLTMELYVTFPDLSTLINEPEELDEDEDAADANGSAAYDGRKRAPEYCNAHRSCLWEMLPFLRHFHPSVEHSAECLLKGSRPEQKPDLANHTLIHFLDKFVYRNPKATDAPRGNSLMQPTVLASGQGSVLVSSKPTTKTGAPLNSASFWNLKIGEVAAEDVFFHEYFSQIGKPSQTPKTKKTDKADAERSDADVSEDEEEIWDALKSSRPEVDGDDSDDGLGSDFADLMSLDGSDDDGAEDGMRLEDASDDGSLDFSDVSSLGDEEDGEEDEGGMSAAKGKKGEKGVSDNNKRRKMLKSLPTFASAEDYAEMLAEEDDEEAGY